MTQPGDDQRDVEECRHCSQLANVAAERDFYRIALETATRRGQVRPEPDPPAALSLDALDLGQLAHLMSLAGWGVSMLLPKAGLYGVNFLLVVYTDPENPQLTANCGRAGAITALRHIVERLEQNQEREPADE